MTELTATEKLFYALDKDIRDRKSIGDEWEQIDSDVMLGEIKPEWEKIIDAALTVYREKALEDAERVCRDRAKYLRNFGLEYERNATEASELADAILSLKLEMIDEQA